MFILTKLTGLLPARLQPYAKAVYPAVATLVGVGVSWVSTGQLNTTEIRTAIVGAGLALVTLGVPNSD
jgi:hypothetical protein